MNVSITKRVATIVTGIVLMIPVTTVYADSPGRDQFPDPIDPQSWELNEDMTWDDYKGVPGIDWNTDDIEPETELKGALILVDFPDRDFILTEPKGSDPANNPQINSVEREDLGDFWEEYLNVPSDQNNYQTIDGFWKENSYGKWGVDLDTYGPYRLDKNEFQYGLSDGMNGEALPDEYESGNLFSDGVEIAAEDLNESGEEYDFAFIVHAGYDESSVWQEFGEMKFTDQDSIPDQFGPPDLPGFEDKPNWAETRYVPWTSWLAAKSIWSAASSAEINGERIRVSIQGESDGMSTFAHEFGHLRGLGDNYNNAALNPRSYSGYWETMSRGAFGGPGGTHTRWMVPGKLGGTLAAPHTLRNKMKQGFLSDDEVLNLDRDELKENGLAITDVTARQIPLGDDFDRTGLHGINIEMEDLTPKDYVGDDWRNDMPNGEGYDNYTLEVVDRVGADSFSTDSGVLISKTKNAESAPFIWVVDSHPEDINLEDFTKPDGSTSMVSKGDPRQLADALFHAGSGETLESGKFDGIGEESVVSEYKDNYNRLHFYILGKQRDEDDVLSYRVAVRNMDGSGDFERGVDVNTSSIEPAVSGKIAVHHFDVTNNGEETDLIRIEANTDDDWETELENDVIEVAPGETKDIPVYVEIPDDGTSPTDLTFTATSETDTEQSVSKNEVVSSDISAADIKSVVEHMDKQQEGAFKDDAAHKLKLHLTSVAHFEEQEASDKIIKHMDGFEVLLDHQKNEGLISESAYNSLEAYANALIEIWQ